MKETKLLVKLTDKERTKEGMDQAKSLAFFLLFVISTTALMIYISDIVGIDTSQESSFKDELSYLGLALIIMFFELLFFALLVFILTPDKENGFREYKEGDLIADIEEATEELKNSTKKKR